MLLRQTILADTILVIRQFDVVIVPERRLALMALVLHLLQCVCIAVIPVQHFCLVVNRCMSFLSQLTLVVVIL